MSNRRALLIAAEQYGQGFVSLPAVREDVRALRATLESCGYVVEECSEEDARNTIQLDDRIALYSWPSQGSLPRYMVDETNVTWSRPRFAAFLALLREQLSAETVHILAHSMGNRLVAETIASLRPAVPTAAKIRQVVFTAPDIDAATFIDLAAAFPRKAERFTLYASSHDKAILASKLVHKYPRAGESGVNLVVVDAVDTVDASAVDTSLLGHSYYGDNRSVVGDIFELIRRGSAPADRFGLTSMKRYGAQYWVFNP